MGGLNITMKYKLIKNKMNKKGLGPLVIVSLVITGILLLLGVGGGILTAVKVTNTIKSIPTIVWVGATILILLLMFPKKK